MKLSVDCCVFSQQFGDYKAMEMIKEAGFDAVDYTFFGAVRTIVKIARENSPNALIVYLAPLKYSDKPIDGKIPTWRFQPLMPKYIDAIKSLCKELDLHFVDCYTPEELNFVNNDDDPAIYGDRLHFGWKGHELLSKYIIKTLVNDGVVKIEE